ncbi:MAG: hypothetical protein ABRQ38_13950 [Candidatus Eremiobacterota bacterium]
MLSGFFRGMNFDVFYREKTGMSFAEVIFAIGIVASVLIVLIGALTGGLQALQKGTGYTEATVIASRVIEEYRALDYTAIPLYAPSSPDVFIDSSFTVSTVVEEVVHAPTSYKCKKVIVNVTRGADGIKAKSIDVLMETFLIDRN